MNLKTTCVLSAVACLMLSVWSAESLARDYSSPQDCWKPTPTRNKDGTRNTDKNRNRAQVEECIRRACLEQTNQAGKYADRMMGASGQRVDRNIKQDTMRTQVNMCVETNKMVYDVDTGQSKSSGKRRSEDMGQSKKSRDMMEQDFRKKRRYDED